MVSSAFGIILGLFLAETTSASRSKECMAVVPDLSRRWSPLTEKCATEKNAEDLQIWKDCTSIRFPKQYVCDGLVEAIEYGWRNGRRVDFANEARRYWYFDGEDRLKKFLKDRNMRCVGAACWGKWTLEEMAEGKWWTDVDEVERWRRDVEGRLGWADYVEREEL